MSEQSAMARYLSVNVYPTSRGWRCSVLVRRAGNPYPRLHGAIGDYELPSSVRDISSALTAASEVLERLGKDTSLWQRPTKSAGAPSGATGGNTS